MRPAKPASRFCRARKGQITCGRPYHPGDDMHRAEVAVDERDPDAGTRIESWRDA